MSKQDAVVGRPATATAGALHKTERADDRQELTLGYLVPEFPSQTHAFFWREVCGLRQSGVKVVLCSTRRPAADACRHDFVHEARATTRYVFPPDLWALCLLALKPAALLRAAAYALGLRESSFGQRLRVLALISPAADLAAHARRVGMAHLHVHSCADAAHLAALMKIIGGPSYSLTLHGDLPVYGVDHRSKMQRASFVSCVTRPLREQVIHSIGLPPSRVPVVTMGVDTDLFVPLPADRTPARLRAITVARLNPTKGHVFALKAVKALRDAGHDVTYVIVGEGPHRQVVEREIMQLGLGGAVEMTGTLSEDDVRARMQAADVFLLPSFGLGEAAPVAVMEAMACGLPVIASRIGGTPDMIRDGVDGFLVEMADASAIENRLRQLITQPGLRQSIAKASRARAVGEFDCRQTTAQLLAQIRAADGAEAE